MTFKATVIGTAVPEAGGKLAPTRLGGPDAGDAAHVVPASSIRPTAIQPTAMTNVAGRVTDIAPLPAMRPTVVPVSAPAPAVVAVEPVKASALPGTQRKPLAVTFDQLAQRFPGTEATHLARAQAILAGICPQSMHATAWLNFGVQAQETLSVLVKERLALMEAPTIRSVAQHLARLQLLLKEVLEAMDGGFLKKPAVKVWESVVGEIRQLESLLSKAGPALALVLDSMGRLAVKNQDAGDDLQAHALAADYLLDIIGTEAGQLLVSRQTSLMAAEALVLEQLQTLALDTTHVQELITLVQDGVLLQLPAVHSQLAGLATKPSDTQRFLATEKLTEIVQFIQRKL